MTVPRSDKPWARITRSVHQTIAIGKAVGKLARAGDLIALVGELGTGKTQLVRGLAGGLGIDPAAVASPTFVLVREYEPASGGLVLVHVDAYRLNGAADLQSMGWDDGGGELGGGGVVVVEWADRIAGSLGSDNLQIVLSHLGQTTRRVTITPRGGWVDRMTDLTRQLDAAGISS